MRNTHPFRRVRASWLALTVALAACENPGSPAPLARLQGASLATVPAQGTPSTLDFGTWNLHSFGHETEGPSDERLQFENVRGVMAGAELDLWALQEVVSEGYFQELVGQLPGYEGFLANDPRVTNGPAYYSDFGGTEQKVGLVYRTDVAYVRAAEVILTEHDALFNGRPPLEVQLVVSLNGLEQNLTVIVLHAHGGTTSEDWERRSRASLVLKSYLDSTYPTERVMVMGDWNDDVDVSITRRRASPYANFVADSLDNFFPTRALSDGRISSTVNFTEMLDHHLGTNDLQEWYVPRSAAVLRADEYVAEYGRTTSDHYPVLTRYDWR
jgi:endonuclease/exonuclease/phosphatase family metal-dependent hydrolase